MHRLIVVCVFVLLASESIAQSDSRRPTHGLPSGIILLPGYTHEPLSSFDGIAGSISRVGGFSIRYALGTWEGNYAINWPQNIVWSRQQNQENRQLFVTLDGDGTLYVSFVYERPPVRRGREINFEANFHGKPTTDEEVAEFLIMVLGYERQPVESQENPDR